MPKKIFNINEDMPIFSTIQFVGVEDYNILCQLSEKEIDDLEKLKEEMREDE
jgi:hypothetical protein